MWKRIVCLLICLWVFFNSVSVYAADLSLNVSSSPTSLTVNQSLTYTINVSPVSDSISTAVDNVQLSYALPSRFNLESASSSVGSCFGIQLIRCNLGTLNNTRATVTLVLKPTQAGSFSSSVNVTGVAVGGGVVGSSASLDTVVTAQQSVNASSDLSLDVSSTPAEAIVGKPFAYNINLLPVQGDFDNMQVRYAVPSQFQLQSISSSQGSCSGAELLTCQIGTVTDSTLVKITINLLPLQEGSVNSSLNVTAISSNGDAIRANEALTTNVLPAPAVNLAFSDTTYNATESSGIVTINILRSDVDQTTARAVSIEYSTQEGSALAGVDYQETSGTLVWAEGDIDPKSFDIVLINDAISEDDEVFKVRLSNPVDASIEGNATVTVTVNDDEQPGDIGFSAATFRGGENDGSITISVLRNGGTDGEITVNYNTIDGSAIAGEDYTATQGTLRWENGDLSPKTFQVPVANDGKTEGDEFFRIQLNQPSNRATLGQAVTDVTILDNVSTNDAIATLQAVARNPVQMEMARVIGTLCQGGEAGIDLQARCTELVVNASSNPTGVAEALQQWAPEEYASLGRMGIEAGSRQVNNVFTRLQSLRAGSVGVDVNDLNITVGGESIPLSAFADAPTPDSAEYQLEGKPLATPAEGEIASGLGHAFKLYELGLFLNGHIGISERDQTDREAGFQLNKIGITGGADYRFSDNFILGATLGYTLSDADFDQQRGNLNSDLLTLGLYGTFYEPKKYYIDFIYSFGLSGYEVERNIRYQVGATEIQQIASSSPDATQQLFGLSAGWHFQLQRITLTPTLRYENIALDIDSFNESMSAEDQAGSDLAISLTSQDVKSTTFALGLQVATELKHSSGMTLIPQLSLEWIKETQNKQRELRGHFIADGGRTQFVLLTDEPDTQYFSLGLGLAAQMGEGVSAFIRYETLMSLDHTSNHSLIGGMRWEF